MENIEQRLVMLRMKLATKEKILSKLQEDYALASLPENSEKKDVAFRGWLRDNYSIVVCNINFKAEQILKKVAGEDAYKREKYAYFDRVLRNTIIDMNHVSVEIIELQQQIKEIEPPVQLW